MSEMMEEKKEPRVLIGCVTHDKDEAYVSDFLNAIREQDYKNFDILFVDTSANEDYTARLRGTGYIVTKGEPELDHSIKRITTGRNIARDYALSKGYDFLWFVDTDILPPKHALSKLIAGGKDVNAGLCLISMNVDGNSKVLPNAYKLDSAKMLIPLSFNDVQNNDSIEVSSAGFGCVLVSKNVLSEIAFRYFENSMAGEDIAFFSDAKEKGFASYADNSVKCAHLVFPPGDPRNTKFMFESYDR
jgi:glycosyltransferase involved in cell wall biosynthesis